MTKLTKEAVEIRRDAPAEGSGIDEIIAHDCFVHVERMNGSSWYLGIDAHDGSHWQFWFGAKNGRSHVEFSHSETTPADPKKRKRK